MNRRLPGAAVKHVASQVREGVLLRAPVPRASTIARDIALQRDSSPNSLMAVSIASDAFLETPPGSTL